MADSPDSGKRSFWVAMARYSQLAFVLPATTLAGWVLGGLLDRWLHTNWIYLLGVFLGIITGFIELIRTALRSEKEDG